MGVSNPYVMTKIEIPEAWLKKHPYLVRIIRSGMVEFKTDNPQRWLAEHMAKGTWASRGISEIGHTLTEMHYCYCFTNEQDAILFALRWS